MVDCVFPSRELGSRWIKQYVDRVFPSRVWEPLNQAVRGSCVSFERLGAVLDQAVRGLNIYIKFIHSFNKKSKKI